MDQTLPLIEQALLLTEKADELTKKRHERMGILKKQIEINHHLCSTLGLPIYAIDSHKIPSSGELRELSEENLRLHEAKVLSTI